MGTSRVQGELWGANARAWGEVQEPTAKPLWERMQAAAGVGTGMDVLDVGCGAGNALRLAKARGARVYGLDASRALLDFARTVLGDADLAQGDLEELPYPDARFDVVMSTNALQFTVDRARAARELVRVKKPGGNVVVGMWAEPEKNEMTAVFAAIRAIAPPPAGAQTRLDLSQRSNLLGLLRDAGLTIVQDDEVECIFRYRDRDEYLAAQRSAGSLEAAARAAGEDEVREALLDAARPFTAGDGSIRFVNRMRYVLAR